MLDILYVYIYIYENSLGNFHHEFYTITTCISPELPSLVFAIPARPAKNPGRHLKFTWPCICVYNIYNIYTVYAANCSKNCKTKYV